MPFTVEQVQLIPEIYRDFLLVFTQASDSGEPPTQVQTTSLGKVFNALAPKYGLAPSHIRELTENLERASLIVERPHLPGYFDLTGKGVELLRKLVQVEEPEPEPFRVPELPPL